MALLKLIRRNRGCEKWVGVEIKERWVNDGGQEESEGEKEHD